jgi:hypothetical protein
MGLHIGYKCKCQQNLDSRAPRRLQRYQRELPLPGGIILLSPLLGKED